MSRSSLVILIILGVTTLVLHFSFLSPKNTVVLTEHGFSPREITVSVGDTVTFVNKRDKYFWPASDFHPTHTTYQEFDAQSALAPHSSWSFTFERTGLFKYHDHLAPFYFGIVRVKDEQGNVIDNCTDRGGDLACWQDQIFVTLAENGISGAYDKIAELYEHEPTFASSCHFIAHNIGLSSYGFFLEDSESVVSPKASACASGFYHGFMEAYLGATGDVVSAHDTCKYIGEALGDEAPDARLQCYHGIGHGAIELLIAEQGIFNSVGDMVSEALKQCEKASSGDEERFRCASGLYNGIANFYINGEYGLDIAKSDPLLLCRQQEKDLYKEACYGNMNSVLFWMFDNNFEEAALFTLKKVENVYIPLAINYLAGLYASNSLPVFSSEDVIDDCKALGTFSSMCVEGFVQGLLEHGAPGEEYKKAIMFCDSTLLTSEEKDICYTESISRLSEWYSPETTVTICTSLPNELKNYCK